MKPALNAGFIHTMVFSAQENQKPHFVKVDLVFTWLTNRNETLEYAFARNFYFHDEQFDDIESGSAAN